MIRWRVCKVVERFACDRDDVRLANFQRVRGLDAEWKLLRILFADFHTTSSQRESRR